MLKNFKATLNASDVVDVNVLAIIGTGGRGGHIVEDDLAYIAEIVQQTGPNPRPTKKAFQNSRFKTPSR